MLEALCDRDALKRRLAMINLAEFVAERLLGVDLASPVLDRELPLPLGIGTSVSLNPNIVEYFGCTGNQPKCFA